MCIYEISCCSPAVVDDMILLSFSKYGLDKMLSMLTQCNGKYEYQAFIVFNETKRAQVCLGNDEIVETTECKHFGVLCDKFMSIDETIKSASNKLKCTFLSLINSGIYEDGFHPLTSVHIYKTAVIPKALYGCELWSNLLPKHVLNIERAHRFCVKFIQYPEIQILK